MVNIPTTFPEVGPWRFEYKYIIPYQKALQVRNALAPYVARDPYSSRAENHQYLVRSLYFDTRNLNFYQEKVDGDCDRVKFRLRAYATTLADAAALKAEIKVRKGTLMEKYTTPISREQYSSFMRDHHFNGAEDPVLLEFERYHWLKGLQPVILIQYFREGFVARDVKGIRITFDHRVASARAQSLFPDHPIFREHLRHAVIMEIKCKKSQPRWLLDLAKNHGLRIITSSKFARGIEIADPAIVTPGWSC